MIYFSALVHWIGLDLRVTLVSSGMLIHYFCYLFCLVYSGTLLSRQSSKNIVIPHLPSFNRCLQTDSWRIVSAGDDKTLKVGFVIYL